MSDSTIPSVELMTELRPLTDELKIDAHLVELEAMGFTIGAMPATTAGPSLINHKRCHPRACATQHSHGQLPPDVPLSAINVHVVACASSHEHEMVVKKQSELIDRAAHAVSVALSLPARPHAQSTMRFRHRCSQGYRRTTSRW